MNKLEITQDTTIPIYNFEAIFISTLYQQNKTRGEKKIKRTKKKKIAVCVYVHRLSHIIRVRVCEWEGESVFETHPKILKSARVGIESGSREHLQGLFD